MRHLMSGVCIAALAIAGAACTSTEAANQQITTAAVAKTAPPGEGYQKVSDLTALPDFIPNLGTLYVKPETLPVGPFLAYDRDGKLVSTIYMVPLADMEAQKKFDELPVGDEHVEAVDMYYNAGHPGVEQPHYHVVLWHVDEDEAKLQ